MNKFTKRASLVLAGAMCFGLLAGCGNNVDTNPGAQETSAAGTRYKIGVVAKTYGNPMFREIAYGAYQAGQVLGVDIVNKATQQEGQIAEQIDLCEDLIVSGVDALVVTPQHSEGISAAVDAAHAANIPFISVDTAVSGSDVECFIGMDNVEAGYAVAKMVAEKIGGEGNVIVLKGMAGASTSEERTAGYLKALAEYPGITVVGTQNADFEQSKGQQVTSDLLQANKDIKAVIACNDLMALGAIIALEENGYTPGEDVIVGCYDISVPCMEAIQAGTIYVTGYHWAKYYGYWGVQMAVDYLDGNQIPKHITSPHSEVTAENVDSYLAFCQMLADWTIP